MVSSDGVKPKPTSTVTTKPVLSETAHKEFKWTTFAFGLAGAFSCALLVWQLWTLSPGHWCGLAQVTTPEGIAGCLTTLTKILTVKDHVLIGLMSIVGITILGLTAVALGVRLNVSVPGGGTAQVEVITDEDKANVKSD